MDGRTPTDPPLASRLPLLRSGALAAIGIAALVAYAAWRASVDLDPPALWLDDAWVAALARVPGGEAWLSSPASAPVGFMAIIAAAVSWAPDLELGAQTFPFACGLLGIGLTGGLAFRLTSNAAVAIVAAGLLACDPIHSTYMARVKPYASDVVVVVTLGMLFDCMLAGYSRARLWTFAAMGMLGLTLSSLSIFVTAPATATIGLCLWLRGVRDRQILGAGALLLIAGIGALALSLSAPGIGAVRDFWSRDYLPASPLPFAGAALGTAAGWVARLVHAGPLDPGPLPLATPFGIALGSAGALHLWLSGRRAHLGVAALVFASVCIASAAERLPLGAARVETFLMPFVAVGIAASLGLAERLRDPRSAALLTTGLAAVLGIQIAAARPSTYPLEAAVPIATRLKRSYQPGDGVWSNILGTYALALYAGWPSRTAANPNLGIPHLQPEIPNFAVMNLAAHAIDSAPPDADRIFVFLCHDEQALRADAVRRLVAAGYTSTRAMRSTGCSLDLMLRGAPTRAGSGRSAAR